MITPKFSLIICTYMRANPLLDLLYSVKNQTLHPDEILIIDGSTNDETAVIIKKNAFKNLKYFKVNNEQRGLTKQRNFGIKEVTSTIDIVCFLDDDTLLEKDYFFNLIQTYKIYPEALGVGGFITNETVWEKESKTLEKKLNKFYFDGYSRQEPTRFKIRKLFKLDSNVAPGFIPSFSHGRSVGFLPPTGKVYPVQQFMGGVSSFKNNVFKTHKFSEYFDGYGLYEDADFTSRLSKIGNLYLNTNAKLGHYHNDSGRPNKYNYGKMIVRNGWYVWRVYNKNPKYHDRLKWNIISWILITIRISNIFTTSNKIEALSESLGRVSGMISLLFSRPKIK
ncbi:glycosyltransferase family 2 protein [Flavobacterium sp.]|uniref:glycosyltransferase family 2 protein n=1 Tax=Flavobacterium sp. TaxID=239 RepID=UPI003750EDF5